MGEQASLEFDLTFVDFLRHKPKYEVNRWFWLMPYASPLWIALSNAAVYLTALSQSNPMLDYLQALATF